MKLTKAHLKKLFKDPDTCPVCGEGCEWDDMPESFYGDGPELHVAGCCSECETDWEMYYSLDRVYDSNSDGSFFAEDMKND